MSTSSSTSSRREQHQKLSLSQKSFAAMGGAVVSAIAVNPLEVLKTRMQLNSHSTFSSVVRKEGMGALWRGTSVQILNSLPTVGVYLMTYDYTLTKLRENPVVPGSLMPLFSGVTARAVAVCLSSPIENVKTIMYSGSRKSPMAILKTEVKTGGVGRLFRGFMPYFWRDVPFSAIYWMTLEHTRSTIMEKLMKHRRPKDQVMSNVERWGASQGSSTNMDLSAKDLLMMNVVSGLTAGMVAAFLTTPVDTIYVNKISNGNHDGKLARQQSLTTMEVGVGILRQHGFTGLFRGVGPRVFKVAPSCAIVISSYEMFKRLIFTSSSASSSSSMVAISKERKRVLDDDEDDNNTHDVAMFVPSKAEESSAGDLSRNLQVETKKCMLGKCDMACTRVSCCGY